MRLKKFYSPLGVAVFFLLLLVSSCKSKEEDEVSFDNPKYETDAALYKITQSDAPWKSIELTEAGEYIIVENQSIPSNNHKRSFDSSSEEINTGSLGSSLFFKRAGSYNGIIHGKYTKISNEKYVLEGFGTLVIKGSSSDAVSLDITTDSGRNIQVGARLNNQYVSSVMTDNLCRSWRIKNFQVIEYEDGEVVYKSGKLPMSEYTEYFGFEPEEIIFTKAGTYMVIYSNGILAVATWTWEDEGDGLFHYSWDYSSINSIDLSGYAKIKFNNNKMEIIEENIWDEDEKTELITYLEEIRN